MLKIFTWLVAAFFLAASPVQAAGLEQTFAQAQAAYKSGQYDQAGALFMQVADMLVQAKQASKSYAFMNNAGISYIKGKNYQAAADVYEIALENPKKVPEKFRAKCFTNLKSCRINLKQHALLIQTIDRELKALPKMPKERLSNVYAQQGDAYRHLEIYGPAVASYDKAQFALPQSADPAVRARILTAMGLCQGNLGDFESASKSLTQAHGLAAATNTPLTVAESDSNLGILFWERGDYPKAMQLLKTSLDTEQKNSLRRNEGVDANNIGLVQKSVGNYLEAMRMFEDSLTIAREVGNKKDEAIALVNRALLNRMTTHLSEAREDYRAALALFEEVGFQEGKAGALLGIGKIAELEDRDLNVALATYREALELYTKIGLPRSRAESLLQIGGVMKRTATPGRTTRDLVFEEAPVAPQLPKAEALAEAMQAYDEALRIALEVASKEMIWSARQGIGFCLFQEGKLSEAFSQYMQAIDMVTAMRTSLASVELLGEYMAGKEDLYSEAMEVCAALYEKTKDQKYIEKQMQLDETLRNEVQKASSALVQMEFEDLKKQRLYQNILEMGRRQAKAEAAIPAVTVAPTQKAPKVSPETKKLNALRATEAKRQKAEVKKLDGDYKKLLAQWIKQYPEDRVIFESSARVKIPEVQAALTDDQIMMQYILLPEKLLILAVAKDKVDSYVVNVGKKEINTLIRDKFLVNYIEPYGHQKISEEEGAKRWPGVLSQLYGYLIQPANASLKGKKRMYVVADGFLAQVPFCALVETHNGDNADFLVEKYEIANVRPSFITSLTNPNKKKSTKKLLAVGNPSNDHFPMASLEAAEVEVKNLNTLITTDSLKDTALRKDATEEWFVKNLKGARYEYLYFATHGVPFSEIYTDIFAYCDKFQKRCKYKTKLERFFKSYSPLNGFLYLGNTEASDGFLTIKEITDAPADTFKDTRYVFLSACNTGVTFSPKTLKDDSAENVFSAREIEETLRKAGWVPGVDQISFVDVFMRRGINNVYGTLWFADDKASQYLMSGFMENLMAQGDEQDSITAYTAVLRKYIAACKAGEKPLGAKYASKPLNPFFWAVGSIFGK